MDENKVLVILDIDGVMTDGTKVYDDSHNTCYKRYNDKDFTAIKIMQRVGIKVCLCSSDETCNKGMAETRGIPFYYSRKEDGTISKADLYLPMRRDMLHSDFDGEVYFIGDDLFDLDIMLLLDRGYRVCPSDAPQYMKNQCGVVTECRGGEGVVAEFLSNHLAPSLDIDVVKEMINASGSMG